MTDVWFDSWGRVGIASLREVACVVLETDGTFSVLKRLGDGTAVEGIEGIGPDGLANMVPAELRRATPGWEA